MCNRNGNSAFLLKVISVLIHDFIFDGVSARVFAVEIIVGGHFERIGDIHAVVTHLNPFFEIEVVAARKGYFVAAHPDDPLLLFDVSAAVTAASAVIAAAARKHKEARNDRRK